MSYKVIWLPEAEVTFQLVLNYLEQHWTSTEILNFLDRTDKVIGFISQNPRQYFYSKKKDAYRAVLTRQVSLYYRILPDVIELLIFWDNRQDPEKLKI